MSIYACINFWSDALITPGPNCGCHTDMISFIAMQYVVAKQNEVIHLEKFLNLTLTQINWLTSWLVKTSGKL